MRILTEQEVRRGLRISVGEGVFATLYVTLAGGMFLTGLALYLGANSFQIALLTAIPALVTGFSFLAGILARRVGTRKWLFIGTAGLGRAVFVVLVPLLLLQTKVSLSLFFAVVAVSSVLMTLAGTLWTSWMSELVPEERRGRFFGTRNAILGGIGVFIAYGAGRGMDFLKSIGHEQLGYGLAFGYAVLFGLASTILLFWQPEPGLRPRPKTGLRELFFGPLKEKQFRRLTIFLAAYFLTGTLASPFYLVHLLKNLEFPFATVGVYSIIGGVIGVPFQLFWGRMIDQFGSRPVAIFNFAFVGIMPWLWLLATPSFHLPIWLDAVANGILWSGASLGLWNLLLELADNPARRESYFAIYTVVTGLCVFTAAMLSGVIAQALHGFRVTIFGHTFVNYHLLFFAAGLARFLVLPLLMRVEEQGSRSVRRSARVLSNWALWRMNVGRDMLRRPFFRR